MATTKQGAAGREIPRDEWISFLDGFSKQHASWLVSVEEAQPNQNPQVVAHELPLEGITASLKPDDDKTISIILAQGPDELMTHNVADAAHLRLMVNQEGAHEGIEFQSSSGVRTVVRFRSPMLPETVDGVVGYEIQ